MTRPLQTLLSLWLALVLVAAPLPVFSAATATAGEQHHCMTVQDHSGHHSMAVSATAQSPCEHCSDTPCDNGACNDQGCSMCYAGGLMSTAEFQAVLVHFAEVPPTSPTTGLLSINYPPLLHPPSIFPALRLA